MEDNKNNTPLAVKAGRICGMIFGSVCVTCVLALVIAVTTKLIMWMF